MSELVSEPRTMVILTGMSGAGRSTTANVLEDLGWYVIDNLPPQMLGQLDELLSDVRRRADQAVPPLAAVVDVRSRGWFADLSSEVRRLAERGSRPTLIFLDATDEALVRRFESVRRPHPLQEQGRLLDGIVREREMLVGLRADADMIIDTSGLNVHALTAKITSIFSQPSGAQVRIAVMSFGFKYGVPLDADFVFDMRFLPNPFWDPELRPFTGRDAAVSGFVLGQPGATQFLDGVVATMEPVIAGYIREGRRYVTIAVGCTGGKHRSVAVAEALATRLTGPGVTTFLVHRDLGRE